MGRGHKERPLDIALKNDLSAIYANSTTICIGNNIINVVANSTLITIANSSGIANLQPTQLLIGNSVVNTTMIAVGANVLLDTNSIDIGNSTVNLDANSTLILLANSTTQSNLTSSALTIGGMIANSTEVTVGGNVFLNATTIFVGNSTVNTFISNNQITVGANVLIDTDGLDIGNSTVNLESNSIFFSLANSTTQSNLTSSALTIGGMIANSIEVTVGGNVYINATSLLVGNSTVNVIVGNTSIAIGNTTANLLANSILLQVANSTSTSNLTPIDLTIGSSLVNSTIIQAGANCVINTTCVDVGNSIVDVIIGNNTVLIGNTTDNISANSTQINVGANSIISNSVISSGGSLLSANIQTNPQTGTTYTLAASDSGKVVTANNASAITITIPAGLPIGFRTIVCCINAGAVTLSNTSQTGALLFSRTGAFVIKDTWGSASICEVAANVYVIDGDI